MRQEQRLTLGVVNVKSFITALERTEQRMIQGGSDRWYICGDTPLLSEMECETTLDNLIDGMEETATCE